MKTHLLLCAALGAGLPCSKADAPEPVSGAGAAVATQGDGSVSAEAGAASADAAAEELRAERIRRMSDVERAFAATMAARNLEAFAAFISEDAVFLNGGKPLRGKAAVVAHWARFFEGPDAPFSWEPDLVEVSGDGLLGQTNGPVSLPDGKLIARFYSTWRLESDGRWRVVFDNGYAVPPNEAAAK